MIARLLPLALVLLGSVPAAQRAKNTEDPFRVLAVYPPPNATNVRRKTPVYVLFNRPVNPASVIPRDLNVIGRWSGPTPLIHVLLEDGYVARATRVEGFAAAGEMVTVTLSRGVESIHGEFLQDGYQWSFWVSSRASSMDFVQTGVITPGTVPYGAYAGDLNRDKKLDLCVPNEVSSDVSVFLNTGNGFIGPTTYPAGAQCSANEGADLNDDGFLDLIVQNISDDDISIFFGNGDGTLQPQVRYPVGDEPRGLCILDVEGDGDFDIVTANQFSNDMSLLVNQGDGTFAPEIRFDGGVGFEKSCVAADMNGDGLTDIVVIGLVGRDVRTLINDGHGNFSYGPKRSIGTQPFTVVAGDIDNDGDIDIAVALAGSDNGIDVLFNNGNGVFGPPVRYICGPFTVSVDFGDLNGDGLLDMSGSSFNGKTFSLFTNLGHGVFGNRQQLPATGAGSCTVLCDIDNDNDIDVIGIDEVDHKIYIFKQQG